MIIRARTIVTMDGAPIENGAIVVSEDRIADVGKCGEIQTRNTGEILDLGEQAILPGLINAHCHLDYTCLRDKIPPLRPIAVADSCSQGYVGRRNLRVSDTDTTRHRPVATKSFTDWIRAINAEKAKLSPNDYLASIDEGFTEAKRFGTTTIANLTAFPELIPQIQPPIRVSWFPELIDIRTPERTNEIVDDAIESVAGAPSEPVLGEAEGGAPWGLAPHTLFTASKELFRRCEQVAERDNILLTTHLAESREEMQMFRDAAGLLYEFLKNIGRAMSDCGKTTPLELFFDVLDKHALPRWIVAHLNELTESDFALLERSAPKFHIVHCPRSHNYFRHNRFEFERLRSLGFNICLGTDSLASNDGLSLFDEMRAFQKHFPKVSPEEILRMVTLNPARALHQEDVLGRIRPGFCADLIAIQRRGRDNPFEEIVAFDDSIHWVMVNGKM
jgi:cytosine/adenosine deaminase-related metal-dependent hydrolase